MPSNRYDVVAIEIASGISGIHARIQLQHALPISAFQSLSITMLLPFLNVAKNTMSILLLAWYDAFGERAPVVVEDLCRYVEFVRDLPFVLVHSF